MVFYFFRLTFSYQAAKCVEEYARFRPKGIAKNTFELALFIYAEIGATLESAVCLAKLGKTGSSKIKNNTKHLFLNDDKSF